MRVLILNQAFYPDVVSTAQHAADLALALTEAGHQVTVICSRRAYDEPLAVFPRRETWKGVHIDRVYSTALGKTAKWRRAVDFLSFIVTCGVRLMFSSRVDVMITLTTPPFLPFVAALLKPLKARRMVFWSMDLNPDEAIAAQWLRENSVAAHFLSRMLLYSLRRSDQIVALDRFMKERIEAKGIDASKIRVIPPWSHDDYVEFDASGRQEFRACHGLTGTFVVMYSGNHSPCHPLDTLLEAARRLEDRDDIVFCLVGGGSEFRRIKRDSETRRSKNILFIPYQPIEKLSASLSAADLHVVLMGNPFVGIVHPCKVYNILVVDRLFLYIGPDESSVADIIRLAPALGASRRHGDVEGVVASIVSARNRPQSVSGGIVARRFSHTRLVPEMVRTLEKLMSDLPQKQSLKSNADVDVLDG